MKHNLSNVFKIRRNNENCFAVENLENMQLL